MCVYIHTHTIYIHIYIYIHIHTYTHTFWVYICIHTHTMEYYSAIKKNEPLPFATAWMDLEAIILNEISQIEKDKYYILSLICGIKK